jgi:WD40 repeat protein
MPPTVLRGHRWIVYGVEWRPDGGLLASGTYHQGVLVWDVKAHSLRWADRAHSTWIRRIAWNPDGTRLVGATKMATSMCGTPRVARCSSDCRDITGPL